LTHGDARGDCAQRAYAREQLQRLTVLLEKIYRSR
jgi:hypothetical protein